ncbi:hypothetical protein EDD15DRAFT_2520309 [Pisolithus albus]|nr:hypothetical protein EDD15DRAFT_2520309 [Pisolithus albus]
MRPCTVPSYGHTGTLGSGRKLSDSQITGGPSDTAQMVFHSQSAATPLTVGGGGRAKASPPPILTPTRLRTAIKATNRDGGLISKAQLRRNQQTTSPAPVADIPGRSAGDNPSFASPEVRCASELFLTSHDHGDSEGFGDAIRAQLDTVYCDSPTPRAKPLDHRQRGSEGHGDAVCVDLEAGPRESPTLREEPLGEVQIGSMEHSDTGLDAGSCDLSKPKKPLRHEQGGARGHDDDARVCLATVGNEASSGNPTSSNSTPGTPQMSEVCNRGWFNSLITEPAYSTVQLLSGTPPPTHSDVATVCTASGTLQVPSVALPTGGDTSTLQMTDVAGDSVVSPEELRFCDNSINPDDIFDGSTFVVGRPSEAVLDMIQEGLDHITAYLTDLATRSGQPPQQILDRFLKQYSRLNPANDWNRYSKYFSHYTERELERLRKSGSFTGAVDGTPWTTYLLYKDYISMLNGHSLTGGPPPASATPPLVDQSEGGMMTTRGDDEGRWWW